MTTLRYSIQAGTNGSISIPTTPFVNGEEIEVILMEKSGELQPFDDDWQPDPARTLPNGKTPVEDFLDFCKERNLPSLTDEKKRQQRIAAEKARIADQTPEERAAAIDDFMTAWRGCLKGVPHMTAKEIRAERLEKKYGNNNENSTD